MAGDQEKPLSTVVKKIKVENWSSFLLQKLYHCYTQKKHCDFTLKMVDGNLKVHSVVMHACSNYFIQINLENSHTVTLPPELRKELMEPIVNFIYSGILTFKPNIQKDLVRASKILKIDILTKLIDTEDMMSDNKMSINKTIPFEDVHTKQKHFLSSGTDTSPKPTPPPLKSALKVTPPVPPLSVIRSTGASPSRSVVSPNTATSSTSGAGKMAIKKLPFWKKRSTTPGASAVVSRKEEEQDVKPCRFELPEDAVPNSSYFYVPNFENPLSYESESIVKPDERILKRVTQSVAESVSESKKMKLIKSVVTQEEEEILPDDDYEDYEFPVRSATVPTLPPKPILKTDKFDSARKKSVRFSTPSDAGSGGGVESRAHTTDSAEYSCVGSSGGEHEDSNMVMTKIVTIKEEVVDESPAPPPLVNHDGTVTLNNPSELSNIDPNHAKIIGEVLQKYPDLVRGNRNFKLKVVNSDNQIINYIMNNKNKCLMGTGGSKKKSTASPARGSLNNSRVDTTDSSHGVSNTSIPSNGTAYASPGSAGGAGTPLECKYCGPDTCEELVDYYTWRCHMTRVHGEKFDVRMCEYCGLRLSKRNLYLYHLLRVHRVRSDVMKFPECAYCSYIALTENLLFKHCKNVHNKVIGFVCPKCNIMFKTDALLSDHLRETDHGSERRTHACPHCRKSFDRSVNLKAHLRANHSDLKCFPGEGLRAEASVVKKELEVKEEPRGVEAYEGYSQYIEVPVMQSTGYGTLVLPGGVTIIDTNNARMTEASSDGIGMESSLVTSSEGMLEPGTGSMEPNEAVLGTNECGQTVLILNGTQQYILEQHPDGRLILPDILANNCVISYAEDSNAGGLDQGGEYEIINVEQAQQEVMMSGQGLLVSHGEVQQDSSRGDPNDTAGETMYGSHEGETILDSQDPTSVPATLVLSSSPYHGSILPGQPMIQTIITTAGHRPTPSSSVIQSTSSSTPTILTQTPLPTSQQAAMSAPVDSMAPLAATQLPQDSDPLRSTDPADHSGEGTVTTDHSLSGTDNPDLSELSHSGSLHAPPALPNASQPVSNALVEEGHKASLDERSPAVEFVETGDYQDGYDSEGGMVIDAPSEADALGEEEEAYEEEEQDALGVEQPEMGFSSKVTGETKDDHQSEGSELVLGSREVPAVADEDRMSDGESEDTSPTDTIATISSNRNGAALASASNPVPSTSPLAPLRERMAESVVKMQALGAAVQAKIQALEEDWGDNLEDAEEEEGEEVRVGPSRGEI